MTRGEGPRIHEMGARIDELRGRIDRMSPRIDELRGRIDAHKTAKSVPADERPKHKQ
jgi:hypothetical protein